MLEQRIIIALVIVSLAVLAYAAFKLWHRRSVGNGNRLPDGWRDGVPGVLYFSSVNCAPCGPQSEAVERIGAEFNALKVDVDEEPEQAKMWNVLSLPTTFVLDGEGTVREVNHGAVSEKKLRKQLERVTSNSQAKSQADKKPEGAVR